jgi:hypothetical protein
MNLLARAARAADRLDSPFRDGWLKDCTRVDLDSLAVGTEVDPDTVDPVMVRVVRERIEARRRLSLPPVDCTARKPGECRCLTAALIEFQLFGKGLGDADDASPGLAEVTKKELFARSSMLHKATPKRKPTPAIPRPLAQMPPGHLQSPPEPPQPSTDTSEPPPSPQPRPRPVRRTPKWFDEDERRSILDYKF